MRNLLAFAVLLSAVPAAAARFQIINHYGDVAIQVTGGDHMLIGKSSPVRPIQTEDVVLREQGGVTVVEAKPADGAVVHLKVNLPFHSDVYVRTTSGSVALSGLLRRAVVKTDTGAVALEAPWSMTRLRVQSQQEPGKTRLPAGFRFSRSKDRDGWRLRGRIDEDRVYYGAIVVEAEAPQALELADLPPPPDAPVKMPWQAPLVLEQLRGRPPAPRAEAPRPGRETDTGSDGIVFSTEVRVVNLTVAVNDAEGRPVLDLERGDFLVLEDGVPQQVSAAGSHDVPFNLALLMDLSGSTQRDRDAMKEAARRFIGITRPQDKVALYALASDWFQVVERLAADRQKLLKIINGIPPLSGGSPIYDTIVLSYAEEFWARPSERNALIVISDGIDNQIQGLRTPSETSFKKLRQAAEGFHALIYPIFLDPFDKLPPPGWSRKAKTQMEELAAATGGRLFAAHSLQDLEPVYAQVAEELRSVYSVAYSPNNQDFNGAWRRIEVRVNRPGVKVRTRQGYFAH